MLKRLGILVFSLTCLSSIALADDYDNYGDGRKGKIELSTAMSVQILASGGETDLFLNIPVRVGAYLSDQILLEGEVIVTEGEGFDAGYIFDGLVSVHAPSEGNVVPFFLAGIGFSNTFHLGGVINGGDLNETFTILNGGVGIKSYFSDAVALRFEYRLQRFSASGDALTSHMFFTGVSLLL